MLFNLVNLIHDQNPWWLDAAYRPAFAWPWRRDLQSRVVEQLNHGDRKAIVLTGARQTGKTVMLLQIADALLEQGLPPANLTYFNFSDPRLVHRVSCRQVAGVRPMGIRGDAPRVLLFDEVGRARGEGAAWVNEAGDGDEVKVCLTESSTSLPLAGGQTDEIMVEPLNVAEFHDLVEGGQAPDRFVEARLIERYLTLGGFPEYLTSRLSEVDPPLARERLRRDIVSQAVVSDLVARTSVDVLRVRKLFVHLVQDSGAVFMASRRAKDLEADRRSIGEWVGLLEETCLIESLPRFVSRTSGRLRGRSKIYAADPGLVAAFAVGDLGEGEIRGRLFEAAVFRHLRDVWRSTGATPEALSYFEVRGKGELDFVLEAGGQRVAIEVTASSQARPDKLARMLKANRTLQADRLFLVYGGVVEDEVDGVKILPLGQFLANPQVVLEEGSVA